MTSTPSLTRTFANALKAHCSPEMFALYLAPLQFDIQQGELHIVAPNAFALNWVKAHCHETLQALQPQLAPQAREGLVYRIGNLHESAPNPHKVQQTRLIAANIPPRYQTANFSDLYHDTPKQSQNNKQVQAYAQQFHKHQKQGDHLIFCGNVGTGKTYLACALLVELLSNSIRGYYVRVSDLMRDFTATYAINNTLTEQAVMARLCNYDFLVIDELGLQRHTDATLFTLSDLLCRRFDYLKPTLLISNWPLKGHAHTQGLYEMLGARVFDRITARGSQTLVFDWPSYRSQSKSVDVLI